MLKDTASARPPAAALGGMLLVMAGVRLYRLIRAHMENALFAPQMLLAFLSLWIAASVIGVGRQSGPMPLKEAIVLIRSGSILLALWGYRLYQATHTPPPPGATGGASHLLDILYMILGGLVMFVGLAVSRTLRGKRSSGEDSA